MVVARRHGVEFTVGSYNSRVCVLERELIGICLHLVMPVSYSQMKDEQIILKYVL